LKLRTILLAGTALMAIAPVTSHAESVCESPIYVFSRHRAETGVSDPRNPDNTLATAPSATSSAVGCTVVHDTVQPGAGFEYVENTDLIYPGSNRLEVRLLNNGRDPSILSAATLTIGDEVIELEMIPGFDTTGAVASWLDSKPIGVDPAITTGPLEVTAHFCLDGGEEEDTCYDRTYRTLPAQQLPA